MIKYILEICTGDCEFNDTVSIEFDSFSRADDVAIALEFSKDVVYAEVIEITDKGEQDGKS